MTILSPLDEALTAAFGKPVSSVHLARTGDAGQATVSTEHHTVDYTQFPVTVAELRAAADKLAKSAVLLRMLSDKIASDDLTELVWTQEE